MSGQVQQQALVPKVTGRVSYEVMVKCPHCQARLNLNEYPYDDEETDYCPAEDELGMALFGFVDKPAKWENIDIPYKCCGCQQTFSVAQLEI